MVLSALLGSRLELLYFLPLWFPRHLDVSAEELDSCFRLTKRLDSADFTVSKMGLFVCPRTQKTFWCLIPINFHRS